jgi:hypothetical protein
MISRHDPRYKERENDDGALQGAHFPPAIILARARWWYVDYPLSPCHVEELM